MFYVNFSIRILDMAHLMPKQNPVYVSLGLSSNVLMMQSLARTNISIQAFLCPSVELKIVHCCYKIYAYEVFYGFVNGVFHYIF